MVKRWRYIQLDGILIILCEIILKIKIKRAYDILNKNHQHVLIRTLYIMITIIESSVHLYSIVGGKFDTQEPMIQIALRCLWTIYTVYFVDNENTNELFLIDVIVPKYEFTNVVPKYKDVCCTYRRHYYKFKMFI